MMMWNVLKIHVMQNCVKAGSFIKQKRIYFPNEAYTHTCAIHSFFFSHFQLVGGYVRMGNNGKYEQQYDRLVECESFTNW